jgi:uncharacterized protein YdcH (DUF465 family)
MRYTRKRKVLAYQKYGDKIKINNKGDNSMDRQLFGGEDSPLRENPVFRKYMEEYRILDNQIGRLQEHSGMLSYEEVCDLTKLKKLKLSCLDGMESVKKGK